MVGAAAAGGKPSPAITGGAEQAFPPALDERLTKLASATAARRPASVYYDELLKNMA